MVRTTDKILIPKVGKIFTLRSGSIMHSQWLLFALGPFFVLSCVAVGLIVHNVGDSEVSAPEPEPEPEAEPEPRTKVGMEK